MMEGPVVRSVSVAFVGIVGVLLLGAPVSVAEQHAAPTFNQDVAPILFRHCVRCHQPGQIAPMSLTSYQQARPWARAIKAKVRAREMPPWFTDPNFDDVRFKVANDSRLTDAEIETLSAWADAGGAQGEGSPPPVPEFGEGGWSHPTGQPPDLVIELPIAWQIAANGESPNFPPLLAVAGGGQRTHGDGDGSTPGQQGGHAPYWDRHRADAAGQGPRHRSRLARRTDHRLRLGAGRGRRDSDRHRPAGRAPHAMRPETPRETPGVLACSPFTFPVSVPKSCLPATAGRCTQTTETMLRCMCPGACTTRPRDDPKRLGRSSDCGGKTPTSTRMPSGSWVSTNSGRRASRW